MPFPNWKENVLLGFLPAQRKIRVIPTQRYAPSIQVLWYMYSLKSNRIPRQYDTTGSECVCESVAHQTQYIMCTGRIFEVLSSCLWVHVSSRMQHQESAQIFRRQICFSHSPLLAFRTQYHGRRTQTRTNRRAVRLRLPPTSIATLPPSVQSVLPRCSVSKQQHTHTHDSLSHSLPSCTHTGEAQHRASEHPHYNNVRSSFT